MLKNPDKQNTNQQPVKSPQNRTPAPKPAPIPTRVINENYTPLPKRGS